MERPSMTHHTLILETALRCLRQNKPFIPGMYVKRIAKWPIASTKRVSELKAKGLLEKVGYQDGFAVFRITKKGIRSL